MNKKWRLQDVYRAQGDTFVASVFKVTHPHRHQRVTVVTVPRYATEEYYKDWVYQPYARDHQLYICTDIFVPTYVFVARILFSRGKYSGYKYFTPMNMPDSVDLNVSRKDYFKRERPLKCNVLKMSLFTNMMRDARHGWIPYRVKNIVGHRYLTHPPEDQESFVLLMPPAYVPSALNALQNLGFEVSDQAEAPCGEVNTLKKLAQYSDIGQFAALSYIWLLIVIFVLNEAKRATESFEEYKREMIRKAGRDPKEFGL